MSELLWKPMENFRDFLKLGQAGFTIRLPADKYFPIAVKKTQTVTLSAKMGPIGWTHDKAHTAKYGPGGTGGAVGQPQYFPRPYLPVGALIGGYDTAHHDVQMDLPTWTRVFCNPPTNFQPVDFGATEHRFNPPISGYLYLIMNDALYYPGNPSGVFDNEGEIEVFIRIED